MILTVIVTSPTAAFLQSRYYMFYHRKGLSSVKNTPARFPDLNSESKRYHARKCQTDFQLGRRPYWKRRQRKGLGTKKVAATSSNINILFLYFF